MSFLSQLDPWVMPGEEGRVKCHELTDFCLQKKNVNALSKAFVPT